MSAQFSDNFFQVLNPITNKEVGRFDIPSEDIINETIQAAKDDLSWSSLPIKKRCYYINKFRKALVKNKENISKTIYNETGKPEFDILIEIFTTLEHLKEITKIARYALNTSRRSAGLMKTKKAYVKYEPLGVAGIIPLAFIVALTGLEILIAFLQAYVFAILTCLYINDALHLH